MNPPLPPSSEPEVKVILTKDDMQEMQSLIDKGWKIASAYPSALGAIFVMVRQPTDVRIK